MGLQGIDILLVEDNPDHVELIIKEIKGRSGIIKDIHIVKDGQEALDYLFRENKFARPETSPRPGLILLDLKLPKIDGLDVLKRIRESKEFDEIPVVVLTTSSHESDIVKNIKSGTNLYITKPVRYESFIDAISSFKIIHP
jgi:two-component system response regulator